ncbi:probable adenylate kinase 5, chloroplastic isoform X1 [Typha latifolia]|uniref:probable adenylate kinase 5, chloroplastic isoform X1 n=2 Tax=Typha latifolia TaxID=4733 RepID=UPI003C2FDA67
MATANPTAIACGNRIHLSLLPSPPPRHSSSTSPFSSPLPLSRSSALSLNSRSPKDHSVTNFEKRSRKPKGMRVECAAKEPLKVMISGAPASGKGTQCKMIVEKYGLVHISTGDILRAEVSLGTEIGKKAKEFMDNGMLVPDEIVTDMVVQRLSQQDVRGGGWLLDGYPRSSSQAQSLERMNIRPDIYIVLDVPDDILIDRCVGRRLDPVTGKIYHLTNFPPESEDISTRLITRSDDTPDKAKSRLETYKKNAEAILPTYLGLLNKVDGNHPREVVFKEIDSLLQKVSKNAPSTENLPTIKGNSYIYMKMADSKNDSWRGIPTRLNNIPHSREIRKYFYDDVLLATKNAVEDKRNRLKVEINIPELNPEMDVYRIGTLMELVRDLALSFADDGRRVKVCVQGSMGEGALAGIPLQLAGSRKILEFMDWGEYGAKGTFINIGAIGAKEVDEQDDIFILVAPQNAVGNCIIDDLKAMTDAVGSRPVILINPRLKDMPASSGIMQTMGRDKRLEYAASFENCYSFRLLYYAGSFYPIMGALRMSYPKGYEIYKRIDEPNGKEKYVIIAEFPEKPTVDEINDAFEGRTRNKEKATSGIWSFLSGIL